MSYNIINNNILYAPCVLKRVQSTDIPSTVYGSSSFTRFQEYKTSDGVLNRWWLEGVEGPVRPPQLTDSLLALRSFGFDRKPLHWIVVIIIFVEHEKR